MVRYSIILILIIISLSITTYNVSALKPFDISISGPITHRLNDTITITVTENQIPIEYATINLDGNSIGVTDRLGKLDYRITRSGVHNITATKLGYWDTIERTKVLDLDNKLYLDIQCLPNKSNQQNIIIVIDASGSTFMGEPTTGLTFIALIESNAIDLIQNIGSNSNVGIVIFGGSIATIDLLPMDNESNKAKLEKFIKEIGIKGDSPTNIDQGLLAADKLLKKVNGTKEIIIISDGFISSSVSNQTKNLVLDLKNKNIKVYFIEVTLSYNNMGRQNNFFNELSLISGEPAIVLTPDQKASTFLDLHSEESSSEEICSIRSDQPVDITVTLSNGDTVEDSEIDFDGNSIGKTSHGGKLSFSTFRAGLHNITATKPGFEIAVKIVQVLAQPSITPLPTQTLSFTNNKDLNSKNEVKEIKEPLNKIQGLELEGSSSWLEFIINSIFGRLKSIFS